jgi:hypothetical protein
MARKLRKVPSSSSVMKTEIGMCLSATGTPTPEAQEIHRAAPASATSGQRRLGCALAAQPGGRPGAPSR